jgi:CDGSH-type Zn-finger protein
MARIVKHEGKGPLEVKVGQESKWICMCGLSKNMPFCDGSHKICKDEEEGKIYKYVNGKRIEVKDF